MVILAPRLSPGPLPGAPVVDSDGGAHPVGCFRFGLHQGPQHFAEEVAVGHQGHVVEVGRGGSKKSGHQIGVPEVQGGDAGFWWWVEFFVG